MISTIIYNNLKFKILMRKLIQLTLRSVFVIITSGLITLSCVKEKEYPEVYIC